MLVLATQHNLHKLLTPAAPWKGVSYWHQNPSYFSELSTYDYKSLAISNKSTFPKTELYFSPRTFYSKSPSSLRNARQQRKIIHTPWLSHLIIKLPCLSTLQITVVPKPSSSLHYHISLDPGLCSQNPNSLKYFF